MQPRVPAALTALEIQPASTRASRASTSSAESSTAYGAPVCLEHGDFWGRPHVIASRMSTRAYVLAVVWTDASLVPDRLPERISPADEPRLCRCAGDRPRAQAADRIRFVGVSGTVPHPWSHARRVRCFQSHRQSAGARGAHRSLRPPLVLALIRALPPRGIQLIKQVRWERCWHISRLARRLTPWNSFCAYLHLFPSHGYRRDNQPRPSSTTSMWLRDHAGDVYAEAKRRLDAADR